MPYFLADVEGVLCVAHSMRMEDEPVEVTNYWPTTVPVWAFLGANEVHPSLLGKIGVREVRCVPGMFLCNINVHDDPTQHRNASLILKEFGKTQSIKVDKVALAPPSSKWPVKYERGFWWVKMPSGWKKRD